MLMRAYRGPEVNEVEDDSQVTDVVEVQDAN